MNSNYIPVGYISKGYICKGFLPLGFLWLLIKRFDTLISRTYESEVER